MRLIDADLLTKEVEKGLEGTHHENSLVEKSHRVEHIHFLSVISRQSTAYDVNKVIEQLADKIDSNVDCETGEPCYNWVVDMQNEIIGECIDIVRGGVINE